MPLHIIADENPEEPAWGELPVEVYFLSKWENLTKTPHNPTSPPKTVANDFYANSSHWDSKEERLTPPVIVNLRITTLN